jgi:hypothetical protein
MRRKCMKVCIGAALALASVSCQTITVVNDSQKSAGGEEQSKWHHTGIYGLVTYSGEYQISELCPGGTWTSVTTQRGVGPSIIGGVLGLAGQFDQSIANITGPVGFAWTPLTLNWNCGSGGAK